MLLRKGLQWSKLCTCHRGSLSQQRLFASHVPSSNLPKKATRKADVVIVGGGIAGLSLAAALKSSPVTKALQVVLVEAQSLQNARTWFENQGPYSNRTSSITPESAAFLREIGAWDKLVMDRVGTYSDMRVWDWNTPEPIHFSRYPEPNGYMVENLNLVHALLRALESSDVTIMEKTHVRNIERDTKTSWPICHLDTLESESAIVEARLLVGADGVNSPVRKFAGIEGSGWPYNRQCMVASLELREPPSGAMCAYQRFLGAGPVAILPFPGRNASLAFHTSPEIITLLKSLDAPTFCLMLNAALRLSAVELEYIFKLSPEDPSRVRDELEWRLGLYQARNSEGRDPLPWVTDVVNETRAPFPLRMYHADEYVKDRAILVGDAAHVIHPLGGQGLNLGLSDVSCVFEVVKRGRKCGADIGSLALLEEFPRQRYFANHSMMGMCDKIHKFYGIQNPFVRTVRTVASTVLNSVPFGRELMMRVAGA